jgi:hypothetical protein
MRRLHLSNSVRRDATIAMKTLRPQQPPQRGLPGQEVSHYRYLSATADGLHGSMQERFGADYGQALVDGDPEVGVELVGKRLGSTDRVYLSAKGDVLYASPKVVEVIYGTDGKERDRRDPEDVLGNVNDELPVRWTGKKLPKSEAVHSFVFRRTIQLLHVDGLTYDYLFAMAKELADEDVLLLVGGGAKGKAPLVFQDNGMPYRGFLEGRVEGEKYMLLLHLSNLELKRPEALA